MKVRAAPVGARIAPVRRGGGRATERAMAATKKPSRAKGPSSKLETARAQMYRDLLFETGEAVFGANGYDRATMQQIASEAGVSVKTLYQHYPSKTALYEEIMRERASAFVAAVGAGLESADDPCVRIENGVRAYVEFLFEHEAWLAIHLRGRVAWSLRPRTQAAVHEWRRGIEDFSKALREGMDRGVFFEEDAIELAALCQGIMQQHMARALDQNERDPELVTGRIVEHLMRLVRKPGA